MLYLCYNTPTSADRIPCYINSSTSHRIRCDMWHRTTGSPPVPLRLEQRPVPGRFPRVPDQGADHGRFRRVSEVEPYTRVRRSCAFRPTWIDQMSPHVRARKEPQIRPDPGLFSVENLARDQFSIRWKSSQLADSQKPAGYRSTT